MAGSLEEGGRDPFFCDVNGCEKQYHPYTRREKLDEHIRSQHTGSRLNCAVCGKQIIRMGDLRKHMRTAHGGEKRFVCEKGPRNRSDCVCGARFTKKSSLNRHQRPRIVHPAPETQEYNILGLEISELRKNPDLWEAFFEVVEVPATWDDLQLFGNSSDELLELCEANVIDREGNGMEIQSENSINVEQVRSFEDIETKLYLRLVALFRRRRTGTCGALLSDINGAFRKALDEHAELIVKSTGFLSWVCKVLSSWCGLVPSYEEFLTEGNKRLRISFFFVE